MLMLHFQEFFEKLFHAFGVIKAGDGSRRYSIARSWSYSSDYYRYVWRRCAASMREQAMRRNTGLLPGSIKRSVNHIIKQP